MVEHYLNRDDFPEQKYRHCGLQPGTFYLRLHVAHQGIRTACCGGWPSSLDRIPCPLEFSNRPSSRFYTCRPWA